MLPNEVGRRNEDVQSTCAYGKSSTFPANGEGCHHYGTRDSEWSPSRAWYIHPEKPRLLRCGWEYALQYLTTKPTDSHGVATKIETLGGKT